MIPPSITRLLLSAGPSSGPYNQFQLQQSRRQYISTNSRCICLSISKLATADPLTLNCNNSILTFIYQSIVSIYRTRLLHIHHSNLLLFCLIAYFFRKPMFYTWY